MARSTARLHIVSGDLPSPEEALTLLFAREDDLLRQLAEVRRAIPVQRSRYAEKHKLLMLPGIATLRRLFA